MNLKKVLKTSYIAVFSFLIVGIVVCILLAKNESTKITPAAILYHATDFVLDDEPVESLPVVVKCRKGLPIILTGKLPKDIPPDFAFCYLAGYCSSSVYINGYKIGGYGEELPLPFGRMVGNIQVIVPIPDNLRGETFKLVLIPYYDISMDISEPTIAGRGSLQFSILRSSLPKLIIITILATVMIIAIVIMLNLKQSKSALSPRLVFYFVLFDLFVILWITCSSDLPQMFTNGNAAVSLISFLSLSLMATPFAGYCGDVYPQRRTLFRIIQLVGLAIPVIILAGYMLNLFDPAEILLLTHGYIIATISIAAVVSVIELHTNFEAIHVVVGIALLIVSAAVGLVCYYKAPTQGLDGTLFGIGCVAFIISLFSLIVTREVKLVQEQKYVETYKELAFTDMMTGLLNRSAFENCFETMSSRLKPGEPVTLFIFDINCLKYTNDTLGHQYGDALINGLARVLKKEFDKYGTCCRLGGDEFGVLIEGAKLDVRVLKTHFKEVLAEARTTDGAKISAAVGYATLPYSSDKQFRTDLFRLADRAMYTDKEAMKSLDRSVQ